MSLAAAVQLLPEAKRAALGAAAGGLALGTAVGALYVYSLHRAVRGFADRRRPGVALAAGSVARLAFAAGSLVLLARWSGLPALGGGLIGFTAARVYLVRRLRAATRWQVH